MCVSTVLLPKVLLSCTLTRDVPGWALSVVTAVTSTKSRQHIQAIETQRAKGRSPTSRTPSEKFLWAKRLQRPPTGALPARGMDLSCPNSTYHASSHYTGHYLHPTPLLACCTSDSLSPRAPGGWSRAFKLWWLNTVTPQETKQTVSASSAGRGKCAHHGPSPITHTWDEEPHCPTRSDLTVPQLKNPPQGWGTWRNFLLPIRRSGEFLLFVRTTGRVIIAVIIKAVIGVLRVVKHRSAPCSAPVEWERWSDVSQSVGSLLPSSLPSVCLIPSLPPPHSPSPPYTHTLPVGVGIVFAILSSQTARLLGYNYFISYFWEGTGGGGVLLLLLLSPPMGLQSRAGAAELGWPIAPGCARR